MHHNQSRPIAAQSTEPWFDADRDNQEDRHDASHTPTAPQVLLRREMECIQDSDRFLIHTLDDTGTVTTQPTGSDGNAALHQLKEQAVAMTSLSSSVGALASQFVEFKTHLELIGNSLNQRWVADIRLRELESRHHRDHLEEPFFNTAIRLLDATNADIVAIDSHLLGETSLKDQTALKLAKHYRRSRGTTKTELENLLNSYGITAIDPVRGSEFDPGLHRSLEPAVGQKGAEGCRIAECVRVGYRRPSDAWVIRPALVVLGS